MAPRDRRPITDLAALVLRQPAAFDFFQAVRVLEGLRSDAVPLGTGSEPMDEALRLRSKISFGFPVADLVDASGPDEDARCMLEAAFMGLAGSDGPLPAPYTEIVQQRARRDGGLTERPAYGPDDDARDFLDIFNHRLLSYFYRARKKHRLSLGADSDKPSRSSSAQRTLERMLFRLIGFEAGLRLERLARPFNARLKYEGRLHSRALLRYTGILACHVRSLAGLEILLSDVFGVAVKGEQHLGRWLPIPDDFQTTLGPRLGKNHALGVNTVLGDRGWEADGAMALTIGPVPLELFRAFLPGGPAHDTLVFLTRFYLRADLDVQVTITLDATALQLNELAHLGHGELNQTAWLGKVLPDGSQCASFALPRWASREAA